MKWQATPAFHADVRRLSEREQSLFRTVVRDHGREYVWPKKRRVKRVEGAPGIWELTWSFSGPDGRATFEWVEVDGEPAIRWRRVGGHEIFRAPDR